ncbi:MBL fold metallo-hydrolase [Clostridium pasteurianum]|uniref:MBL fold metallo-hydrolase n=1 Tax=Clostridium pasteurianum TaxID=1501 RepID=UPI00226103F8|nr:MBL fold metallo-hydrolase RNA specificity domain-containing protein [Clostridium pasteurianum]UZW13921.1 MBL fold metallo-hydrolase [Clostridium pasteurianum]
MNISFLGGANEVGGSCILISVSNKNILLDCGIRQSSSKDPLPDFKTIQDKGGLDAIIISHAHMDHIGSLPIISKEYPFAKIYTTIMTKDLMKVLLYDSLKIMNNRELEIPLYAEADVENMMNRIVAINYMREIEILKGIKLTFHIAGHIAGAACSYIISNEGTIFYSGDFSIFSQKTIDGLKVPKLRPDVAIFETTYGDRLHSNREVEEQRLLDFIRECEVNKGKILIPAFALGRAQEILLIIKKALNKNIIKNIKVYVDGMIKDINRVYKINPLYLKNSLGKKILKGVEPFYDDNIIPVDNKELRNKILEEKEPCVIVSSSGMLTGGYSQYYAEKIASMENGYIIMTGYQDEESPGRKLLNLLDKDEDRVIEINGKLIPVNCNVEKVGLSAHSDKSEIKSLINLLTPNNIFMVHGNEEIVKSFTKELFKEVRGRVYAPECGESYDINIKNPRKQLKRQIKRIIGINDILDESNIKKLWEFIFENYGERLFTIEELIYIWYGDNKIKSIDIDRIEKLVLNSVYFDNDMRRLFLFKCKTIDEVEEETKERELKPNEINEIVKKYFNEFHFKKASIMYEEKKIILSFDFPYNVNKTIYDSIENFKEKINWKVEINPSVNINAVNVLIRELFYDVSIKKISYRMEDKKIQLILNSQYNCNGSILKEFKEKTGLDLLIQNSVEIDNELNNSIIEVKNKIFRMEQNQALNFIDDAFKEEEFKPYKKSVKSSGEGKYIELFFITSSIGNKYKEKLKSLVENTGWNMSISHSANQNEIINFAVMLCKKNDIILKRNPSFNSSNLSVLLKPENKDANELKPIKEEFEYKTGCVLNW